MTAPPTPRSPRRDASRGPGAARALFTALAVALAAPSCSTPTTADGMRLDAEDLRQLAAEDARLDHLPPIEVRAVTGGAETSAR